MIRCAVSELHPELTKNPRLGRERARWEGAHSSLSPGKAPVTRLRFLKADVTWKLERACHFTDSWACFLLLSHQGSAEKHQDESPEISGVTVLVTMWVHVESGEALCRTQPGCPQGVAGRSSGGPG